MGYIHKPKHPHLVSCCSSRENNNKMNDHILLTLVGDKMSFCQYMELSQYHRDCGACIKAEEHISQNHWYA